MPLVAGFGKLAFGPLVVLPGVAAPALLRGTHWLAFDQSIPALMALNFGPTLLALGTSALLASLMAGLAGNVSGFSALWTEEIYRTVLRPGRSEQHYIRIGRIAVVACFLLALFAAYLTLHFLDLMEFLQLIAALLYAPVFAAVVAGLFGRKISEPSALAGIVLGLLSGFALQVSTWTKLIHFGSQMTSNFYTAILSFATAMLICLFYKGRRNGNGRDEVRGGMGNENMLPAFGLTPGLVVLSATLLASCLLLNVLWW